MFALEFKCGAANFYVTSNINNGTWSICVFFWRTGKVAQCFMASQREVNSKSSAHKARSMRKMCVCPRRPPDTHTSEWANLFQSEDEVIVKVWFRRIHWLNHLCLKLLSSSGYCVDKSFRFLMMTFLVYCLKPEIWSSTLKATHFHTLYEVEPAW